MCGRYSLATPEILAGRFHATAPAGEQVPLFNIRPTQTVPVVVADQDGNRIELMSWGLLGRWAKDRSDGLINARAETVDQKPSFRHAFQSRRCLVPASSFFEWAKTKDGKAP